MAAPSGFGPAPIAGIHSRDDREGTDLDTWQKILRRTRRSCPASLVCAAEGDPCQMRGMAECCAPLVSEPLGEADADELAPLFKAIADPVRLRLLSMIGCHDGGEACVCDLT